MIDAPLLPELDRLFARLDPGWDAECQAWLARLVEANGQGHVCLPLADAAARRRLRASPLVGRPGDYAPLIFDPVAGLYFARHWYDETRLAEGLLARAALRDEVAPERLVPLLDRLFPAGNDGGPDRQKLAAALAARQRLLVISGGPGTGKTTTVVRLLALLAQLSDQPPAMALAAPTGKAAARLSESVRGALSGLPLSAELQACLPDSAQTLHRLLGLRPGGVRPRYDARHPLPLDVLVIDEASMIDLSLMARTLDALPASARLILLGDRDQLSSVDAGAVLGDLCCQVAYRRPTLDWLGALGFPCASLPEADDGAGLADAVALLTVSHRFSADSGIGALSRAVNQGDAASALALLDAGHRSDLAHDTTLDSEMLYRQRDGYWQQVTAGGEPAALSAAFNAFMVLAAERRQVEALNQAVESRLERDGRKPAGQPWYPGRPVMIAANDYALGLFNGDIGFTVVRDGGLRVAFADADGGWRELSPARLPAHETVYAMTVHKSQGSEFEDVWLALPDAPSPLADRALVYTAITRARSRFRVLGAAGVLAAAIALQSVRHTGLAARLRRP